MKKLLCLIILLFSFIRSEAQSDHICPHEKLYVHTDRANYERGDTVRFRAYLMDTRREATAYSRYVYAELLADSQVISREMVKDDHGVFSGYLSLGDTLRSGNYTLRFYTRYLSSLPAPRYFYRQIIVGGRPFQDYRKESVTRMAASYHVSFFPEGGRLPSGCVSRVAFKALSPDGLGTDVQGFVVNQRGDTVTTLRSVHRGMGFFNLEPVSGDSYTAVCRNREGMELRFPLPPADPSAVSLRVDVRKDDFLVRLNSGVSLSPGHSLRVEYRDSILLHAAFSGSRPLRFLRSPLPPGVLRFVLLDGSGVPISGRTAFNQSPSVRADVDFSARLKEEKGRSFWDVSLGLRDSLGEPLGGTLSVSVTDDRYALQDTTVNILSAFLLSSDLQGYVEAPSFYFSSDDSRTSYLLDLLMLTQGWVKYSLVPDRGSFPVERSQCVSGKVVSEYSERSVSLMRLSLYSLSIKRLCVRRRVMLRAVSVSTVFPSPGVRISFFRRVRKREVQMWRCWSIGIPFLLYILLFPFMRIGFVQRWMNRLFPNNPVMILLRPVRMCFNDLLPPLFPWSNI